MSKETGRVTLATDVRRLSKRLTEPAGEKRFSRVDKVWREIATTPAVTIEDVAIKLRALLMPGRGINDGELGEIELAGLRQILVAIEQISSGRGS